MGRPTITHQIMQRGPRMAPLKAYAADGIIHELEGYVALTKSGVNAMTLADPPAALDGFRLTIRAHTANAHTVDNSAGSGFNGAGAGSDVATFGGAIGDQLELVSYAGAWHVLHNTNVVLA